MKYLIVTIETTANSKADFQLCTRKQFDTYEEAIAHIQLYDASHVAYCSVLECPHGVTYDES